MSKSNEMQFPFTSKSKGVTITEDETARFNRKEENRVPIHLKMTLTIKEAAEYSNIGINKIDSMLRPTVLSFCMLGRENSSNAENLKIISAEKLQSNFLSLIG